MTEQHDSSGSPRHLERPIAASLADSYALCHQIARRTAKNFYFSFIGLPQPQFQAMCALYAFMRITDDVGDDEQLSLSQRRLDLVTWTDHVRRQLSGDSLQSSAADEKWSQRLDTLPAIADVVKTYALPEGLLFDVLAGIRMDLDDDGSSNSQSLQPRFETFSELETYCYHVAGVVGLCCIHIWGVRDQRALPLAVECGLAFQLTNILRDLGSDARGGRVYVPREDLVRCDYSVSDIQQQIRNDEFRSLMKFEVQRARHYYERATGLFEFIDPIGHPILEAMLKIYGGLLDEIEKRQFDVYSRRVSLPRWRKLLIAAAAFAQRHSLLRPHFPTSVAPRNV